MKACQSRLVAAVLALVLTVVAVTSALAAPTTGTAASMATDMVATQGVVQASYGGITFSYDASLATNVQGYTVASNVGRGASLLEIRPEHTAFSFEGYPATGRALPQIRVIPLAEYKSIQAGSSVNGELSELERYLGGETSRLLPLLPPVNAKRIINEDVASVAGTGISGVRFVASYAQGPVPVTADDITYIFIGITSDGGYYVDGVFPVSLTTTLDPAPSPFTAESALSYNQAVAGRLRDTDASGFMPTLDTLDKMMGSVQVNPSGTPGMPSTGAGTSQYEDVIFPALALATILIVLGAAMHTRAKARP